MTPSNWDGSQGDNSGYGGGGYSGGGGEPPNSPVQQIQKLMAVLNWSVPIGVYLAVRVRVHILLLGYAVYKLFTTDDLFWTLRMLLVLFISVLLHEFGHILACRKVGGRANDILMWPLGGLAYCAPPHDPWSHFVTIIWGPMVNLFIAAAAYITLYVWRGGLIPVGFNPFSPWIGFTGSTAEQLVALTFVINYFLLLFNLCMVFYPLDGGRIVWTILWAKLGYGRGSYITSRVGIGGAIIVLLFGLIKENQLLTIIAFFGLFESIQMGMRLKAEAMMGSAFDPIDYGQHTHRSGRGPGVFSRWIDSRRSKARNTKAKREQAFQGEVDRILDKVRDHGMQSLTSKEKRVLAQETQRKRRS
ncbi:MAG: site-2 protease family protein [Phycisphaerales bacterium]